MAFAIYSVKWRLSARRPMARGRGFHSALRDFPPRANRPKQKKFKQVRSRLVRIGYPPETEKKLCLPRAETPASEEARGGDSRNERSPQEKKSVAENSQ